MPSPFPGMDPYLEDPAVWRGFHGRFIFAITDALLDRLPSDYDADVDEQVRLVEVTPGDPALRVGKDVLPDVAVMRTGSEPARPRGGDGGGSGVATIEPVDIEIVAEREERERWIRIIHRPDDALVTVIEVLSPTNKNSDGYPEYRAKRAAILAQNVSLVELDLLLGGHRMEDFARGPAGDYFAVVARAEERHRRRLAYGWPLRHRLPTIPVPLRPGDGSVDLDLSAAFADAYDRGRYARRLRYGAPPQAPLGDADRAWAVELARPAR